MAVAVDGIVSDTPVEQKWNMGQDFFWIQRQSARLLIHRTCCVELETTVSSLWHANGE